MSEPDDASSRPNLEEARAAKKEAQAVFTNLDEIVGIGITRIDNKYALKINVSKALPEAFEIPAQISGVPIKIEVTGALRKQSG